MPPRKMTTLEATAGQDEANFGTERFSVNPNTHTVDVPEEAAAALVSVGMFKSVETPTAEPDGLVRVTNPDGGSCSYRGVSYEPDADGTVMVPAPAVHELAAHGFAAVEHEA